MADEEAEQDSGSVGGESGLLDIPSLKKRLLELETGLRESSQPAVEAATEYCQQLCQVRMGLAAWGGEERKPLWGKRLGDVNSWAALCASERRQHPLNLSPGGCPAPLRRRGASGGPEQPSLSLSAPPRRHRLGCSRSPRNSAPLLCWCRLGSGGAFV